MTDPADKGLQASKLELWRGDRCLFRNVAFEVRQAQYLNITGPNGCGKTSLLRMVCGFTLPETGEIFWNGTSIRKDRHGYNSELIYVGHTEGLKADLTARENLLYWGRVRAEIEIDAVDRALDTVGLEPESQLHMRFFSAGMSRRLALARLLVHKVTLWMLDEPLTNLDVGGRELVSRLVDQHVSDGGIAVIATHQELGLTAPGRVTLELS